MHSKHVFSESEQIAGPKCLTFYEKLQYHLTVSEAIKWHNLVSQAVSIKILMFLFGVDDYNLVLGGAGSWICCDCQFCNIQESCCLITHTGFCTGRK